MAAWREAGREARRTWLDGVLSGATGEADPAPETAEAGPVALARFLGPREEQQDPDALSAWSHGSPGPHVGAVIADGMGGRQDGARASRMAVRCVLEAWASDRFYLPRDILAPRFGTTRKEMIKTLRGRGGTTLTAAVWWPRSGFLAHVGTPAPTGWCPRRRSWR